MRGPRNILKLVIPIDREFFTINGQVGKMMRSDSLRRCVVGESASWGECRLRKVPFGRQEERFLSSCENIR